MEDQPRRRDERKGRREEEKARDCFSVRSRDVRALDDELEELCHAVIGAAIEVYRVPGPGLPEVVYRNALSHGLSLRMIPHLVEAPVPVE